MTLDILQLHLSNFRLLLAALTSCVLAILLFWLYIKEKTKLITLCKKRNRQSLIDCKSFSNFPSFYIRIWRIIAAWIFIASIQTLLSILLYFADYPISDININHIYDSFSHTNIENIFELFLRQDLIGFSIKIFFLLAAFFFISSTLWEKMKYVGRIFIITGLLFSYWSIVTAPVVLHDRQLNISETLIYLDFINVYIWEFLQILPWHGAIFYFSIFLLLLLIYLIVEWGKFKTFSQRLSWNSFKTIFTPTKFKNFYSKIRYLLIPIFIGLLLSGMFEQPDANHYLVKYTGTGVQLPGNCLQKLGERYIYLFNPCLAPKMHAAIALLGLHFLSASAIWKWLRPVGWTLVGIIFPFFVTLWFVNYYYIIS